MNGFIEQAKDAIESRDYPAATALALVGIAELLAANMTETYVNAVVTGAEAGVVATAQAMSQVLGVVGPCASSFIPDNESR